VEFWKPERPLPAEATADLDDIADAIAARVRSGVIAAAPDEPLWAVCLEGGFDAEPILIPAGVHLCSVADRTRVLAAAGANELWAYCEGWATGELAVDDLRTPAFQAREEALHAALASAGSQEPNRYVLNVAARALSRADWRPVATSDDFLTYVRSLGGVADLESNVPFSATPEALALLQQRNLLFDTD
jgi:hypothetical protein